VSDAYLGLNLCGSALRSRAMHSAKLASAGTILVLHPDIIRGTFDTRFHGTPLSFEIVGFLRSMHSCDNPSEAENFLAVIKKRANIASNTSHSISPTTRSFKNDDAGLLTPIPVIAD
jgi:hypothetical protein